MRLSINGWILSLPLALALAAPVEASPREPIRSTRYFEFFSDFSMNLHDALLESGRARTAGRDALFRSGAQRRCFEALAAEERMGWNLAVDFYASNISPGSHSDRRQMLQRLVLYFGGYDWAKEREQRIASVAEAMRDAAAPAYEACQWSEQDATNRAWVEGVAGLLAQHEEAVGERLQRVYQMPWPAIPMPVDVVATVSWAGADTIILIPPPGHIMVSSTSESNQGPAGLEIVFHEASHLLALDGSPFRAALNSRDHADDGPGGSLWHPSVFYLTGEVVRSVVSGAADRAYLPYMHKNALYSAEKRQALADAWDPYLDGRSKLAEAADRLLRQTASPRD